MVGVCCRIGWEKLVEWMCFHLNLTDWQAVLCFRVVVWWKDGWLLRIVDNRALVPLPVYEKALGRRGEQTVDQVCRFHPLHMAF
jgi:hypothetical protein